jgi:inorganic pyrophosphatase
MWDGRQVNGIIETPKNSPNKYAYDPSIGAFRLDRILPSGMAFPFDFGFVPGTLAADGDPVDLLILMDAPAYPGSVLRVRLVGILECEQKESGAPSERNDRVIGVAAESELYSHIRTLGDIPGPTVKAIESFFVDYHRIQGREFRVLHARGPGAAATAIRQAQTAARRRS